MEMKPGFPTFESTDNKPKKELNEKISKLLQKGTNLADIVELLDAQEFFKYIGTDKEKSSAVAHFDVDDFIKKRLSENRKFSLPDEYIKINETILPSQDMEMKSGNGTGFKELGIIPRSTMLIETLTEMGLKYSVVEGKNDPKMVRKLSYLIFTIPSMQKMVLVNDEEGNATFIIHKAQEEEWKEYMKKTKEELSEMPYNIVSSINYPNKNKEGHQDRWRKTVESYIINTPKKQEKLNKKEMDLEKASDNWLTLRALSNDVGVDSKTVKKFLEVYRKDKPDWFKLRRHSTKNTPREHISPELVEITREHFEKRTKSNPERWLTARGLSESGLVKISDGTIMLIAQKYKKDHPEWFEIFRNKMGNEREYYSPELIAIITNEHSVPKEWMTVADVSRILGIVSYNSIYSRLNKFRQTNPEWFKKYKDSGDNEHDCYSPELIKTIRKELNKS